MSKHVEAEGGELLIRSSNGYMAIVPKNMASWVKEHISSGNHAAVDHYVKGLQEMKDGKKAEYGMKMEPPVKAIAAESTGNISGSNARLNYVIAQKQAQKEKDYEAALKDKTGKAEEYFNSRYKTSPHRYKYDTDPEYKKQVDKNAEETSGRFGSIDIKYSSNPNLAFMTHKGMSSKGKKALEESNLMAIGSVLPIPGLQTVGKVPSIFSPLIKAGSKVASFVKAEPFVAEIKGLEGQISKLKTEEAANENLQKSLWADVKSGKLSKQDYAKRMNELPDVISRRAGLERQLRQTRVKKDIHNLPQENILQSESQLGKDIRDGGSNTIGVYELGNNHVARLSAHGYDDASRLLRYKDSIKSPRIARTLQVKNINGKVYQVQEKVTGTPITNLTEAEVKQIPQEHINNFWKDKAELDRLGLNIDISGGKSNIFYDPKKGFQIIDLGIGKPSASDVIIKQYPFLEKPGMKMSEFVGNVIRGREAGSTTLASPSVKDIMSLAKPSPSSPESVVLADFKARIQTPEGRKRLANLGISEEKLLNEIELVSNPAEPGAYYEDINYATVNPGEKMPGIVARHEIEHAVQAAYQKGREKMHGTPFDPFPFRQTHRVLPQHTDIDRSMALIETWDEPMRKADWKEFSKNYSRQNPTTADKAKMDLNYFIHGSEGREKSAFLGEVQQYMLDKKVINNPYQKITMDDVKNAYKESVNNNEGLRLFNIMKPTSYNFSLIRDNLNKMLSITGAAGAGVSSTYKSKKGE